MYTERLVVLRIFSKHEASPHLDGPSRTKAEMGSMVSDLRNGISGPMSRAAQLALGTDNQSAPGLGTRLRQM